QNPKGRFTGSHLRLGLKVLSSFLTQEQLRIAPASAYRELSSELFLDLLGERIICPFFEVCFLGRDQKIGLRVRADFDPQLRISDSARRHQAERTPGIIKWVFANICRNGISNNVSANVFVIARSQRGHGLVGPPKEVSDAMSAPVHPLSPLPAKFLHDSRDISGIA